MRGLKKMKRHKWDWIDGHIPRYQIEWKQVCLICGAKRSYNILGQLWNVGYIEQGVDNIGIPKLIDKPWCGEGIEQHFKEQK